MLRVYQFTNLRIYSLPFYHSECLRYNFKTYLVKIASKTGVNFSICMDVKREVRGEFECFKFAHLNLFEAHVRAFEKFGHEAKHGGS